jgi:hypothetical protein
MRLVPVEQEYYTVDDTYGFSMHTFVNTNNVPDPDKFIQQLSRRTEFLCRGFIETLSNAEKILVFKDRSNADLTTIFELHALLRTYGNNSLLFVQPATLARPSGTIEILREGLMLGSISRFGNGAVWNVDFDGWQNLCEAAMAIEKPPQARPALIS